MSQRRETIHRWDFTAVVISFLISSLVETGSLFAMFSTMGHAGPEGGFALIGWLSTAFNLPGLFLISFLRLPEDTSTVKLAAAIYALQLPVLWYITFIFVRWWKIRFHGPAKVKA